MVKTRKPKILAFDIETMANIGWYFELYREGNIVSNIQHWYMLSFAYKWVGENKTYVKSLPDFKLYKKDKKNDRELTLALWKLFDEADVVIAHNGQAFDVKKANALFLKHGLTPPSYYAVVDTKLVAKKYFRFDSNKLDDLADFLKIGRKLQTGGFDLWLACDSGDKKAWKKMCDYNIHDVILLEKVYLRMRPYMTNHPNMNLLQGTLTCCVSCGSKKLIKHKQRMTKTGWKQQWQCQDCGSYVTDNKNVKATEYVN